MRQVNVLSLMALTAFIAFGFTMKAQADSMGATASPIGTQAASALDATSPQRGVDATGKCTQEFIHGYSTTGNQIKALLNYVKISPTQAPPNLGAVLLACSRFEAVFPNVSCSAMKSDKTMVTIGTAEVSKYCESTRTLAAQFPPANPGGVITDNSPVSTINPKNLSAQISNASKLLAAAQTGAIFVINGEVMNLSGAINQDAAVRCAILREGKTPLSISNGETIKGSDVDEAYANSTHISQLAFANVDLMIRCATKNTDAVTLGDLKKAFYGILNFNYTP